MIKIRAVWGREPSDTRTHNLPIRGMMETEAIKEIQCNYYDCNDQGDIGKMYEA
jgi:hypothetical protein